MSVEEFLAMPESFGWKHEYFDGAAWIQPWEWHVHVEVEIPSVAEGDDSRVRPLRPDDADGLIGAFERAFESSVEFCGYSDEQFRAFARERIEGVLTSTERPIDRASRAVVDARELSKVVGGALVRRGVDAPVLEIVYLEPRYRRGGIGTALLNAVFAALRAQDDTVLRSSYHVCNAGSAAWHERMGFRELDDLWLAERRHRWWRREAARCEKASDREGAAEARTHEAYWDGKVQELEAKRDRDGWDAVTPYRLF